MAHWGMSERDGHMRTHQLVNQVAQRFGCSGRGGLLQVLSAQLQNLHELEHAWREEREASTRKVAENHALTVEREGEVALLRQEADAACEQFKRKLTMACQAKMALVEVHRQQEHANQGELAQSKIRLEEQKAMVQRLIADNEVQKETITNAVRKYEELAIKNSSIDEPPEQNKGDVDLTRRGARRGALTVPDATKDFQDLHHRLGHEVMQGKNNLSQLQMAQRRASETSEELEVCRGELSELRASCTRLKEQAAEERAIALRFEALVKRVALAPSSTIRTGGGFFLDSAAKREAMALLRAAQAGEPLPPSEGWAIDAPSVLEH
eukprot:TRINITY_DN25437_c0_g1_i1.p2 TRINITY_DN25437_c0_g1~~TRINITY_DN25437_c0_g1_i1.p2  ORF type:complete len:324 (-),score=77.88 TRINITY_DN25437_c0_g1_i1:126-1097(-)